MQREERVGRVGDGWLPSFCTVEDAAEPLDDSVRDAIESRRPEVPVDEVIPVGLELLRTRIEEFVDVGASKFVVVPLQEPPDSGGWIAEVSELSAGLFDLQS